MRRVLLVVTVAVVGLLGVRTRLAAHGATLLSEHLDRERVRLRAHFDSVLSELAAVDVSTLGPTQRDARATLIRWLTDYRDAGQFPLNDLGTHGETPIFRDARGVLCAMAYLIERSGRGDLVDEVARSRNTAYIGELVDDSRLVAWLDSTGLSEAEAARIQPEYGPPPPDRDVVLVERNYAVGSMLSGGASLVTATVNAVRPSAAGAAAGFVVGALTLWREWHHADHFKSNSISGFGEARVEYGKDSRIRAFTIGSGATAVLAATWVVVKGRRAERGASSASFLDRVSVTPTHHPVSGATMVRIGVKVMASGK